MQKEGWEMRSGVGGVVQKPPPLGEVAAREG